MRYIVRQKFFALGEDNTIDRDDGTPAYRVDGKALSLRNRMDIYDMQGHHVGAVHRKLVSMLPRYEIELDGGAGAVLQREMSLMHPRWELVAGNESLQLTGNLLQHDFTFTRGGTPVATVSRAWVTLTSTYGVEVQDGENDLLFLAAVLALEADENRDQR